eukprot:gene30731-34680_t
MAEAKVLSGAGLRGQVAGQTALSTVGQAGAGLTYRGYDVRELAALSIREQADPTVNRVMCPRTEWGKQVVAKVNAVLHAQRNTARYRAIVERWSDEESLRVIHPQIRMKSNLAARLLRIIFGCYFIVTLVVTCVQLAAEYRHTQQRLDEEIGAMEHTFGPGITGALWRFNGEVLGSIVTGVKALPIVIGVKVEDEQGKLLRAIGTVNDAAGKRMEAGPNGELVPAPAPGILFDRMFSRNFAAVYVDEAGERHPVGRWTVYSSQQVVVRQVAYGFFLILVNSVIKTLALWFIFLYVIKRTLGQPLRQMSDFVGQLNIDNIGDRHFVLKDKGKHELHQLTDKLNQMAGTLRKSVAENAELYAELKEMNRTLESQVAERTRELQRVASTNMRPRQQHRQQASASPSRS